MNKLLVVLLIVGLLIPAVGSYAALDDDPRRSCTVVVITSDSTLTSSQFSTSNDALLDVKVFGKGVIAGIYDSASVGATATTNLITEAEAADEYHVISDSQPFPFRKTFDNGLTVIFNDADIESSDMEYGVILYIEADYQRYN